MKTETPITPARGRRLVPFRNCFCGVQAVKFYDGQFLCLRHFEADRARYLQDPKETAAEERLRLVLELMIEEQEGD
jgi:hypothetical protein